MGCAFQYGVCVACVCGVVNVFCVFFKWADGVRGVTVVRCVCGGVWWGALSVSLTTGGSVPVRQVRHPLCGKGDRSARLWGCPVDAARSLVWCTSGVGHGCVFCAPVGVSVFSCPLGGVGSGWCGTSLWGCGWCVVRRVCACASWWGERLRVCSPVLVWSGTPHQMGALACPTRVWCTPFA